MPDPRRIELTCRDLAEYEDHWCEQYPGDPDGVLPAGTFGMHDASDLDLDPDLRCLCPLLPVGDGWSAETRMERNRKCQDPLTVVRPGYRVTACCRCAERAERDDDAIAEAGRRVARVLIQTGRRSPEISAAVRHYIDSGATSTEAALAVSVDLALAGGGR